MIRGNLAAVRLLSHFNDKDKQVTKEALAAIDLFSKLNNVDREKIASIAIINKLSPNTKIYTQNSLSGYLFFVFKGEVEATRSVRENQVQTLAVFKEGDFFGAVSVIDGGKHSATCVCVTDSEIITIKKTDYDNLMENNPILGIKVLNPLISKICSYLRATNTKIADLSEYISTNK
jgi:CRP/FNR family transcriptional regulator